MRGTPARQRDRGAQALRPATGARRPRRRRRVRALGDRAHRLRELGRPRRRDLIAGLRVDRQVRHRALRRSRRSPRRSSQRQPPRPRDRRRHRRPDVSSTHRLRTPSPPRARARARSTRSASPGPTSRRRRCASSPTATGGTYRQRVDGAELAAIYARARARALPHLAAHLPHLRAARRRIHAHRSEPARGVADARVQLPGSAGAPPLADAGSIPSAGYTRSSARSLLALLVGTLFLLACWLLVRRRDGDRPAAHRAAPRPAPRKRQDSAAASARVRRAALVDAIEQAFANVKQFRARPAPDRACRPAAARRRAARDLRRRALRVAHRRRRRRGSPSWSLAADRRAGFAVPLVYVSFKARGGCSAFETSCPTC